eukprot:TRINITY_DN1816_c0_g1_i1.p2 TRINITY_DN1816_c0_g1~~TRINITY_DN1816_c0_g1_i1.p2  ORF type:complete len:119 (-),score=14.60 TRINITY_DN1816_c0_g1_i1:37-393(-)
MTAKCYPLPKTFGREYSNGASLRPNTPMLQEVIRNFRGRHTTVYRLPQDTPIPDDLILLHEHTDHFSLQCAVPMTLSELNKKLTTFCQKHGEKLTKQGFCDKYPFESANAEVPPLPNV